MNFNRRRFIKHSGITAMGLGFLGWNACNSTPENNTSETSSPVQEKKEVTNTSNVLFPLSLAEWSLHKTIQSGELDPLDFAAKAKNDFGIDAVEHVSQLFGTRGRDVPYLKEMRKRADDAGVKSLLIMVDNMGPLAHPDNNTRQKAIQDHYQWVEAAHLLGCHSIRVNIEGAGSAEDMGHAGLDGLATLAEFAKDFEINVIVENHGGQSSDAQWLAGLISKVRMPNCGTLPDFGNFCIEKKNDQCIKEYDRYQGVKELMPFAKAVSAKSYDFDAQGNETTIDYKKMMQIVKDGGYTGHIGVEYEGSRLSETEGIRATKQLLDRVIAEMS